MQMKILAGVVAVAALAGLFFVGSKPPPTLQESELLALASTELGLENGEYFDEAAVPRSAVERFDFVSRNGSNCRRMHLKAPFEGAILLCPEPVVEAKLLGKGISVARAKELLLAAKPERKLIGPIRASASIWENNLLYYLLKIQLANGSYEVHKVEQDGRITEVKGFKDYESPTWARDIRDKGLQ